MLESQSQLSSKLYNKLKFQFVLRILIGLTALLDGIIWYVTEETKCKLLNVILSRYTVQ